MKTIALDAAGRPVPGSEVRHVIQRQVEFVRSDWAERSDTRLLPGQSATLSKRIRLICNGRKIFFSGQVTFRPAAANLPLRIEHR